MSPPLVSILLPCRNARETLDEALSSIREQTLQDFEVLAIDDHSNDGSDAHLASAAALDPRIRFLRSSGRGLVSALNFGLSRSQSEFVARMDADDRMAPRRLEVQHRHLCRHPDISVLGCRVRVFPESRLTDGMRNYLEWLNACVSPDSIAADIYVESPLAHPSVMFRKQAIQRLGGYRQGPFPEDYDLWLRLVGNGAKLAKVPQVLLEWRDSPNRASRQDPRCSREAFDRLRACYLAGDARVTGNRENLAIWGAGRITRKRAGFLLERGFRPSAWIDIDPRKIGNRLDGVPVVAPAWLQASSRPFVLNYVAVHGARARIERELDGFGYRKGAHYLNVG